PSTAHRADAKNQRSGKRCWLNGEVLRVKLRGRAQAPSWSRGCTLSSRTRGDTTDGHGPLQRLLDAMVSGCPARVGGQTELRHEKPKHEVSQRANVRQKANVVATLRVKVRHEEWPPDNSPRPFGCRNRVPKDSDKKE